MGRYLLTIAHSIPEVKAVIKVKVCYVHNGRRPRDPAERQLLHQPGVQLLMQVLLPHGQERQDPPAGPCTGGPAPAQGGRVRKNELRGRRALHAAQVPRRALPNVRGAGHGCQHHQQRQPGVPTVDGRVRALRRHPGRQRRFIRADHQRRHRARRRRPQPARPADDARARHVQPPRCALQAQHGRQPAQLRGEHE